MHGDRETANFLNNKLWGCKIEWTEAEQGMMVNKARFLDQNNYQLPEEHYHEVLYM
jgi:hypothetical protein